ncbi:SDR family oxidoreductase [Clostridium beijerinckii]|uniref:General stress protein 39 n=1 Tax=Clostridium beijerinckii TaxID=1520 RepID=A0A1S8S6V4_CLOBE|nr:SDR family oxidoreductase [Clostridium beijerinckii]MBA8935591.1 NAD(P)-dependent dehydrogenase (short-subunit alcohol dehydrogenase family) [Clostridium beijerinckii]NMF06799.1 SDR family oxidoreductase [Clostridium beijerinckii]NRU39986.1 NAD(P)-dependent dehydrogenase (short-subunit alcohol dehydrogenase family) [Clostridium beijerinckii]NRY62791.1 NAD(P)-dependent dehydrogenase (short-subunit alcohol dehydrogenase family) [Clostridium beijerinckii]NSA96735.1 NAD(P)-dependent dehydrogena
MNFPTSFPKQEQNEQPGLEYEMNPAPIYDDPNYNKKGDILKDKIAVITGGDSGIGKAVAIAYANQGADIVIAYYNENKDAEETKKIIDNIGRKCTLIKGDISDPKFCNNVLEKTIEEYGKIDILVNNAAVQYESTDFKQISDEQFDKTFKTNVYGTFYMTRAALNHLKAGGCIINTASITAYKGNETLIDYSMTKGAIVTLTRSLSTALAKGKTNIRVNAVAPGPIWTPLIPASFDEKKVEKFGSDTPLGRAGQPVECAGAYVFLASQCASYITGQVIHVNGGEIVNA